MNKTHRKILVTGGAGFIGSNLIPHILAKDYSVTAIDNLHSGKLENLAQAQNNPNFKFKYGDIRDKSQLHLAIRDVDTIVHLAALIDISESVTNPLETHEVNVTGTLNVLQEAIKNKTKRFIFASSTAVYGDTTVLPVKETTLLSPLSPYAASKAAGEAYTNAFANCYNIETVTLRFFNVYGPKNENSPYSGVITTFLRKTANNEALTIEDDGEQTRDFIHVTDIAEALTLAIDHKKLRNEVFNVCTGSPTSINQLAQTVQTVSGKNLQIKHTLPRTGDIRHSYGDPSKAASKLGFKSKITIQKGLETLLLNPK